MIHLSTYTLFYKKPVNKQPITRQPKIYKTFRTTSKELRSFLTNSALKTFPSWT